jgi:hypothetical protein
MEASTRSTRVAVKKQFDSIIDVVDPGMAG